MPALSGFTPAYAGNTLSRQGGFNPDEVHPRIRGEYFLFPGFESFYVGSPPHTRGILMEKMSPEIRQGFTPAYAGNTSGLYPDL